MFLLITATWAFYRQHPLQALLALLGIVLGVAAISAMDGVHRQASQAHQQALRSLYGPASHEIRSRSGAPLDEQHYVQLRLLRGDLRLAPLIRGPLRIQQHSLELVGIDPFAALELGQFGPLGGAGQSKTGGAQAKQSSNGAALTQLLNNPLAVAMGAETANRLKIDVGAKLAANISGRDFELQLVQTWPGEGWSELWVLADLAQAQRWLHRAGQLDRILYAPRDAKELAWLQQQLPVELTLASIDQRQGAERMSQAFYTNLRAMGLLAWLLGLFLAYNAYALLNRQRWREFAHWRTLGITRSELLTSVALEALLLGALGGVLGMLAGRWLAALILPLVTSVGANFYGGAIAQNLLPPWDWRQLMLGPGAALAASAPLAWSALRLRPAQLGRLGQSVGTSPLRWWALVIGLIALGMALLLRAGPLNQWLLQSWAELGASSADQAAHLGEGAVNLGFAVLFLLMIGYALLVPALLQFLLRLIPAREQLSLALLRQQIQRQGVAQAAFVLALAAGLGIGVMIQSFRDSVVDWLDQVLWADLYLSVPNGGQNSPLDAHLLQQLAQLPGVEHTGGVRTSRWPDASGEWYNLNAYALADPVLRRFPLFPGALPQAYGRWQRGEGWFVNESLARLRGIEVGQVISLQSPLGAVELPVLAINADYSADEGALVLNWDTYRQRFADQALDAVGMNFYHHDEPASLRPQLQALLPGDAAPRWISQQGIQQRSLEVFDQTFSVTLAGRGLILVIALVALAGAMTAMVEAQRPWLGTLRALGATPRELLGVILLQGLWLGLAAAILAFPLGLSVSWVLAQDIMRASFGWLLPLHWEWGEALRILLQALAVALVASFYPAWRWRHENLRRTAGE